MKQKLQIVKSWQNCCSRNLTLARYSSPNPLHSISTRVQEAAVLYWTLGLIFRLRATSRKDSCKRRRCWLPHLAAACSVRQCWNALKSEAFKFIHVSLSLGRSLVTASSRSTTSLRRANRVLPSFGNLTKWNRCSTLSAACARSRRLQSVRRGRRLAARPKLLLWKETIEAESQQQRRAPQRRRLPCARATLTCFRMERLCLQQGAWAQKSLSFFLIHIRFSAVTLDLGCPTSSCAPGRAFHRPTRDESFLQMLCSVEG
mmetsp:Transcript_9576/g.30666  ORF Transcript_9576/g.30666 Transcript_9576/m.30666 type:complete len:259 (+) Transcript_9576:513-1289(+)